MKQQIAKANGHTKDTYQRITDYVIEQLENGEIIWQKKWNCAGLPKNIITGHIYIGWNVFFLNFVTQLCNYKTPYFLTYKQAMDAGGSIRRGQKGYPVIWWATIEDKERIVTINDTEQHPVFRMPKTHIVFNIDQAHGINFPQGEKLFRSHTQKIQACEKIINEMHDCPYIKHGGDKAFYQTATDSITIPVIEQFHSDEAYYKTLFHELAHSTGQAKRLNRKELLDYHGFGSENYSKEELTAELTAAFLCAVCAIEADTISNSAAYIKGWLKALQNDKRLILKAAAQAQAAADYILNNAIKVNDKMQEETAIQ